jgi:hypothetical protein
MNNHYFWNELFASNKQFAVAIIEVFGALITRESYYLLKRPGVSRFKQFLARAVITIFLSILVNGYLAEWTPKYHFLLLGLFSISCIPILDWFLKSLLPGALVALKTFAIKWIIGLAEKAKKDIKQKQDE